MTCAGGGSSLIPLGGFYSSHKGILYGKSHTALPWIVLGLPLPKEGGVCLPDDSSFVGIVDLLKIARGTRTHRPDVPAGDKKS